MNGDLKQTFIVQCLTEYMESSKAAMIAAAARMKVHVTGEGIKSIAYTAMQLQAGGTASLTFKEYLRMVDMGAGRGHPLGGLTTVRKTLQASRRQGLAQVKDKVRKPKKMYSKIVYSNLSHLQGRLLYGYTEETIAMLKNQMQQ